MNVHGCCFHEFEIQHEQSITHMTTIQIPLHLHVKTPQTLHLWLLRNSHASLSL